MKLVHGRAAVAAAAALMQAARGEEPAPFSALEPGAAYAYRFQSGSVMTLTLEERSPDGSVWTVTAGEGDAARLVGRLRYDAEGRVTAFLRPDGTPSETYEPHNCERVVGLCSYQVTDSRGVRAEQRIGGRNGDEWSFSVFLVENGAPTLLKVGTITYDGDGVVRDELWMDAETGAEAGARRIE